MQDRENFIDILKDCYFSAIQGMQAQKISENLYTDICLAYVAVYKISA